MKRVLIGLASAAAVAGGTALAADVAPYYRAPPVAVVVPYTWTGFYAGANVGGAWTDTNGCGRRFRIRPPSAPSRLPATPAALRRSAACRPATIGRLRLPGSSASKATGRGRSTGSSVTAPWIVNPGGGAFSRFFHHHELDARLGELAACTARLSRDAKSHALRHRGRRPGQDRLRRKQQRRSGSLRQRAPRSPARKAAGSRAAAWSG